MQKKFLFTVRYHHRSANHPYFKLEKEWMGEGERVAEQQEKLNAMYANIKCKQEYPHYFYYYHIERPVSWQEESKGREKQTMYENNATTQCLKTYMRERECHDQQQKQANVKAREEEQWW